MADFRHSTTAPAANSNGHFSTSRRALFRKGAGCVTAIAASTIAMPPAVLASASSPQRDAWTLAKARFVQAEQEHEQFYVACLRPASAALEPYRTSTNPGAFKAGAFQRLWEKYCSLEQHSDHLFDLKQKAMSHMVACPAPDLAAVKFKLQVVIADEAWESTYGEEMISAIMSDLDRLGGA